MSLEDFTASVEQEGRVGEKAFEPDEQPKEKETPSAAPTEKELAEKPSQGGDNTSAEKPQLTPRQQREESRWQKAQTELAELRKFRDDAKPRLETYEQMMSRLGKENESTVQIPEWFPKSGNIPE